MLTQQFDDAPQNKNAGQRLLRLRACQLDACESRCCYDGVHLEEGEEEKIRSAVAVAPELFKGLPTEYIVDGAGDGSKRTRKTATQPYDYKKANFPSHFTRTRCVFCNPQHKCLLQIFSVNNGLHKWAYKPSHCWAFPYRIIDGKLIPPPAVDEMDPHYVNEEYPGYVKFLPCGQDREDGIPWEEALSEELAYYIEWHTQLGAAI